jgi:protein TonB
MMALPATMTRWLPAHAADRRLALAIAASLLLHGLLLSLHFGFPEASRMVKDRALEIVLVNSKSSRRPSEAQALAQANLDGGGSVDERRRAKTPLPPSASQRTGAELEQKRRRVQEMEARQKQLLAEARSRPLPTLPAAEEKQPEPVPALSGRELANSARAMVRMEAEIDRNIDEYNQRPRKKFIGTRTEEYRFARYIEDWRLKVERVGTLNYPEAAKGKLYGSLVLSVSILADGRVEKIEVNRSSGHKVLDDAARRIVQMASPYAAFPPDIRRDTDIVEITRTWTFTRGDALETR